VKKDFGSKGYWFGWHEFLACNFFYMRQGLFEHEPSGDISRFLPFFKKFRSF